MPQPYRAVPRLLTQPRLPDGLALAAVAIAGAAALAALLYGLTVLALVVFWENVSL